MLDGSVLEVRDRGALLDEGFLGRSPDGQLLPAALVTHFARGVFPTATRRRGLLLVAQALVLLLRSAERFLLSLLLLFGAVEQVEEREPECCKLQEGGTSVHGARKC